MAVRTRIEPLDSWIDAVVREDLSPEAQSRALARFARESIADTAAANRQIAGRDLPHTVWVDGRRGAPLESVRPRDGTIVAEWQLVEQLLRWLMETLVARSPRRSGAYRRGHRLFADGREIGIGGGPVPPALEYAVVNLVPYARKIEMARTRSGRAFVVQVPNRIYERTAADAKRRFGNIARIRFTYRSPIGGAAASQRSTRSPAIVISVR